MSERERRTNAGAKMNDIIASLKREEDEDSPRSVRAGLRQQFSPNERDQNKSADYQGSPGTVVDEIKRLEDRCRALEIELRRAQLVRCQHNGR